MTGPDLWTSGDLLWEPHVVRVDYMWKTTTV